MRLSVAALRTWSIFVAEQVRPGRFTGGAETAGASVVEDDVEEGTVDAQTAIIVDEAQLAELIQKEIHPGPRGADHLGQRFLTDLRNH